MLRMYLIRPPILTDNTLRATEVSGFIKAYGFGWQRPIVCVHTHMHTHVHTLREAKQPSPSSIKCSALSNSHSLDSIPSCLFSKPSLCPWCRSGCLPENPKGRGWWEMSHSQWGPLHSNRSYLLRLPSFPHPFHWEQLILDFSNDTFNESNDKTLHRIYHSLGVSWSSVKSFSLGFETDQWEGKKKKTRNLFFWELGAMWW